MKKRAYHFWVFGIMGFCLVAFQASATEERGNWICKTEAAGGVAYDNGKWRGTAFRGERTYTLSYDEDIHKYLVRKLGQSRYVVACMSDFSVGGYLTCDKKPDYLGDSTFRFNSKSLRFSLVYAGIYVGIGVRKDGPDGELLGDDIGDTPSVEVGKCSPF